MLELKWTESPLGALELNSFKGKIDSKLVGTVGVFVSMGGYKADAVERVTAGKSSNLILFDGSDMDMVFDEKISFREAMSLKLRVAHEEGAIYTPLTRKLIEGVSIESQKTGGTVHEIWNSDSSEASLIARAYPYIEKESRRRYCRVMLTSALLRPNLCYEWQGVVPRTGHSWKYSRVSMDQMLAEGRIEFMTSGTPVQKRYLDARR